MFRVASTLVICVLVTFAQPGSAAADGEFTVRPLHFTVAVGPDRTEQCEIEGDLYVPAGASATTPAPAILTTGGFGKSKDDLTRSAALLATAGYVVLAYSGLGFGGSSCVISLDDPDYDGAAASELVSFLGGAGGIAYTDAAQQIPAPVPDFVMLDGGGDPRVGMLGGSYGGDVQFAAAALDDRIDALVPLDTWNDLSVALAPNSADTGLPGVAKLVWILGLTGVGVVDPGAAGYVGDPARAAPCPNFTPVVCTILTSGLPRGYPDPAQIETLRRVSVATYIDRVTVPTLLIQGQTDTLFDLGQSRATYDALTRQGTVVALIWHRSGHSDTTTTDGDTELRHADRILAWFDRYLRGIAVSTGPEFSYYRDWAPAEYGTADTVDVGSPTEYRLAPAAALVADTEPQTDTQTFTTVPGGLPNGLRALDPRPAFPIPTFEAPGTFARWTAAPLSTPLDVVGAPRLRLRIDTLPTDGRPDDAVVVFAKLYDVAPDGSAQLVGNHVAPIRTNAPAGPLTVTMPPIVHRFAPGHSVRLELAGGDMNYRGGLVAHQVTVASGPDQVLTLPVVTP